MTFDFSLALKNNPAFFTLKTQDLELCLYTKDHIQGRFEILANSPEMAQWMTFDPPQKVEDTLEHFKKCQKSFDKNSKISWSIFYQKKLIGTISLENFVWNFRAWEIRTAELGYWINPKFQNKGFMTQAVRSVLKFGFEILNLNKIEVAHASNNIGSQKVIEKSRFRFLGEQKYHFKQSDVWNHNKRYELLRSEWKNKNSYASIRKSTKKGEVWMVDLGNNTGSEQNGIRPCLILNYSGKSNTCIIIPASNTNRLHSVKTQDYSFLVDQIRTIDTQRCIRKIERISVQETQSVVDYLVRIVKKVPPSPK